MTPFCGLGSVVIELELTSPELLQVVPIGRSSPSYVQMRNALFLCVNKFMLKRLALQKNYGESSYSL